MKRPKAKPSRTTETTAPDNAPAIEATEQKGDLLSRDLWNMVLIVFRKCEA